MIITQIIKEHLPTLSNKQKKIARYLMRNKNKIGFMSLKELSNELEVSEVTILNFCKSIGLDSFVDLKKEFQILIKEELKVPAKMKSSLEELESIEDAIKNTLHIQKINLERMIEINAAEALQKSSHLIENARVVYLCGLGLSRLVCDFLQPRLKRLHIDARILYLEDINLFTNDLLGADDKDLFILISFPMYSNQTVKLAQYLKKHQLMFLAITNDEQSPIAHGAEVVLKAENHSLVFYNFISATITLAELLLVVLSYNMKDKIQIDIHKLASLHDFFSDMSEKKKQREKSF
ncbi:MAG: MurR/RpiR family transcriptional regulator [Thermotaleaceae bacterium]